MEMNVPILAIAVLTMLPLLLAGSLRGGAAVLLLASVGTGFAEGWSYAAESALVAGLAGLSLWLWNRRGWPFAWSSLLWLGLCCAPFWLPATGERLTGDGPGWPAWSWSLWPAAGLADEAWDPLRSGWLYEVWGSRAAAPQTNVWLAAGALTMVCALLYFLPGARPSDDAGES